jgi:hypothetical protein
MTTRDKCPCELNCKERREVAVNHVLKEGICTTAKLKKSLENEYGKYTIVKSVKFLTSGDCGCIVAYMTTDEQKPVIFGRQGKLLFVKNTSKEIINNKIVDLLTAFQKRLLLKFTALKRVSHFSLYDLKRLTPAAGNVIDYSVNRLEKLGFLEKVRVGNTDFYATKSQIFKVQEAKESVMLCDITEFTLIKTVHELIMNLYPPSIMLGYNDAIRPRRRETLKITGGMTFDLFYQFRDKTIEKRFLAIDVYTRFPVTGYTVNSFVKKIAWARVSENGKFSNYLEGNTYGMIIFRIATPGAIRKANRLGIRFLRLEDLKINYKEEYEKVSAKFSGKSQTLSPY